ncbi:hypothetical_protein [Leishmania braziliensis MHOM/BR/75/M2904]|uniref:Hypothetical_protein n=1 Tax=Leishmania braziliensis MHOM/BR/75/M2904 TaxID=420245 RepID=A0A3P3ZBG7_LEIBR|nr:unnamed protein product [Leishmania braziliensis]SYZ67578.1 hypothetical_protein [Leishmania braziliensis MHOM/BR/75/M2904]
MPTTSASSPQLLALRSASGTTMAPHFSTSAAAEAAATSSDQEMSVKTVEYDEDWHRLPSDISYVQDLLASLETRQHGPAAASSPLAAMTGGPSYTTAAQRDKEQEAREIADQRVRERQVTIIEGRRCRLQRRCDAIDEAFHNALKRRWHAMQHLAADPPAERLVGQGMTQYVPAALLPDGVVSRRGVRQPGLVPLVPQSAVESQMCRAPNALAIKEAGPASAATVRALTDRSLGAPAEQDTIVFLTQLDPDGRVVRKEEAAGHSYSPNPSPSALSRAVAVDSGKGRGKHESPPPTSACAVSTILAEASMNADADEDGDDKGAWMRPTIVTEANKAHWHEMGYRIVVVGEAGPCSSADRREADAVRRAIRSATTSSSEGVAPCAIEQLTAVSSSSSKRRKPPSDKQAKHTVGPRWDWIQLAPLPPMCLVQRRLPEEDMTVAELRKQHHRRTPVASSITSELCGRQSRRDRSWRMSSKPAPH